MTDALRPTPQADLVPPRRTWSFPILRELPKLTELTLASAIGGGGGTGGSGSTVFALLLAVSSLAVLPACSADRSTEPGTPPAPKATYAVSCEVTVAAKSVSCGGPLAGPGEAILGGQDRRIVLTSSGVTFDEGTDIFEFDVTVQNLTPTTIGFDGASDVGVDVFFTADPVTTAGSGDVTVLNGLPGTFLSTNHPYFHYAGSLVPYQTSGAEHWQLQVGEDVDAFTFTVLVAAFVEQVTDPLFWTEVEGLNHNPVVGVASNGSGNAIAVGSNGASWRLNGFNWDRVTVAFPDNFADVAATGGDTYLAALGSGFVMRFNGTRWEHTGCNASAPLYDISARDATHWIAVGSDKALVNDGGICTETALGVGGSFAKFADAGPDGRYLAVTADGIYFLTADGIGWEAPVNLLPLAIPFVPRTLTGAFLDADGDLIWSFRTGSEPHGALVRNLSDTIFATVGEWPDAIAPMDPDGRDSVTVAYGNPGGQAWLLKVEYTGAPDTTELGDPITTGEQFTRISNGPATGSDWLAVGTNFDLYRMNGTDNFFQGPEATTSASLWTLADTTFLVNGSGAYYRMVAGGLIGEPTPFGARAIAGYATLGETALWAIDEQNVWARFPGGPWINEWPLAPTDTFTAIAVSSASNLWVAVGKNGLIIASTGSGWAQLDLSPFVESFTAASIPPAQSYAFLTTAEGFLYVFDGNAVYLDGTFGYQGGGPLLSIGGTGPDDVWLGGAGGALYHRDEFGWVDNSALNVPPFDITSLTSTGPGQALAGMPQGFLIHYSMFGGGIATAYKLPGVPNSAPVTGISVLPNGRVHVAGANFTFLGRR